MAENENEPKKRNYIHKVIDSRALAKVVENCGGPYSTSPSAGLVWLYILRQTKGFRTERAQLKVATIARQTGLNIRDVQRALRDLEDEEFISVHIAKGQASSYEIRDR